MGVVIGHRKSGMNEWIVFLIIREDNAIIAIYNNSIYSSLPNRAKCINTFL